MRVIFHCLVCLEFLRFKIQWRNLTLAYWLWLFFRRHLFRPCHFSYVFLDIFSDFELKFKLPHKKLHYSILLYLSGNFVSAIDGNAADNSQQIYHENCIDRWNSAHVGWLFCSRLNFALEAEKLGDCERGIQFDEVEEGEFEIETGDLLFQHWFCEFVLAIVKNILHELQ